ncbi:MAG: hypothetical protein QOG53_1083 [Frankiales bacterium]|nr:hypothetical protein [Frankiales bacterium]
MAYPHKLLGEGEEIVHELHPHWKALVFPVLLIPIVVGLSVFLYVTIGDNSTVARIGQWAVLIVAAVILIWGTIIPWLRWMTTLYVLTTDRLITRTGILSRAGRDIPLSRVNDVSFSHNVFERILRCGTLTVESAGERGQLVMTDVPKVETVQRELYRLVEAHSKRRTGVVDHEDEETTPGTPGLSQP